MGKKETKEKKPGQFKYWDYVIVEKCMSCWPNTIKLLSWLSQMWDLSKCKKSEEHWSREMLS